MFSSQQPVQTEDFQILTALFNLQDIFCAVAQKLHM